MDFWDLVKVMWRRWYVTAPMLLLTAAAASWMITTIGPEYQATGYVTVLPPQMQRQAEAGQVSLVNPWNQEALADAARIRLEGKRLHDELAAEGRSAEWAVEITGLLPVIGIEVVAGTPQEALDTMHLLQGVVEEEVQARQAELGLNEGELYTTERYDEGESVETTGSRLRRALVAVLGAGLILTTGTVVAFDAVLRWRQNRTGQLPTATSPAAPATPLRRRYMYGTGSPIPPVRTTGNGASTGQPAIPELAAAREPNRGSFPIKLHLPTELESTAPISRAGSKPAESKQEPAAPKPVPEDSTIVLPLAKFPWAGRWNGDRAKGDQSSGSGTGASKP
jgi:hypothetical protein